MEALSKLGIDLWSVVLYLINFGVLLLLLHRVAYKPLLAFIDRRRQEIKENVEVAEAMRAAAEAEQARIDADLLAKQRTADERIDAAKRLAKQEARALLAAAAAQKDAVLSDARAKADAVVARALTDAEQETRSRIVRVVAHVLKNGVSQEQVEQSVADAFERVVKRV